MGNNAAICPNHTIGGGGDNLIFNAVANNCSYSFIGGGFRNCICNSSKSVIAGGGGSCLFGAVTCNFGNLISGGYGNFLGGGQCNVISSSSCNSVIGGGGGWACVSAVTYCGNCIQGNGSFLGGGQVNCIIANCSVIGGGYCNTVCGDYSAILGGNCNCVPHGCNYVGIFGCNITAVTNCAFHANTFVANCMFDGTGGAPTISGLFYYKNTGSGCAIYIV